VAFTDDNNDSTGDSVSSYIVDYESYTGLGLDNSLPPIIGSYDAINELAMSAYLA